MIPRNENAIEIAMIMPVLVDTRDGRFFVRGTGDEGGGI